MDPVADKPPLTVVLANPRGFCAGVDRAIKIVERALEKFGAPVYVRHEIVHNRYVVDALKDKGAVFVEELDDVPDDIPVIFSAHGVPKSVPMAAEARRLSYIDATCPLVGKVHREAEKHHEAGRHLILIGHAGHPEVIGTLGQLPEGAITLVNTRQAAETVTLPPGTRDIAYITQTTLSVDETAEIIAVLSQRFPALRGPKKEDICYATTNRQEAVKALAARCDAVLVLGAPNSSNSKRLVEVARQAGCARAMLLQRAVDIDWAQLGLFSVADKEADKVSDTKDPTGAPKADAPAIPSAIPSTSLSASLIRTLGITAGASAPEVLVEEVIDACRDRFTLQLEVETVTQENLHFKLPRLLQS